MCGIAVIFGPGASSQRETLQRMLAAMAHRGPDGDGDWASPSGNLLLGHRRLSIIDPEGGKQPMCNEDQTIWITFNGCIYNYQDLAQELRLKGHIFRTHCDTEVILHAYEEWGPACVSKFNGMWGFALWDEKKRTLFCSRDRLGVKPFYYTWDGQNFSAASEIKALFADKSVPRRVHSDGLRQYLAFQYCLGGNTLFEGVKKLEPGHNLIVRPGGDAPKVERYWDFSFNIDTDHTEDYFVRQVEFLLQDAVRIRLRADVPLGAHLSGGLDSSAVTCLARRLLGDLPLKTFTGAFHEGRDFDETAYAKQVSKAAGTQYMETYLTSRHFSDSIEKIIWHMDEPAAGPGAFPQYWVSKLASENVKVVLGGQGGDETFIGYARYLIAYLEECIKGAIEDTAHRQQYVVTLETIVGNLPTLERYVPMLKSFWSQGLFDAPSRRYFRLMDRLSDTQALLHGDLHLDPEVTYSEFAQLFDAPGPGAKINRIMRFDVHTHLQALLHVEDRTSMAWGLESRVPLLDYRLIELMARVPPVIKFRSGELKYLFRRAVQDFVPADILNRKDKMGFPVPLNQWAKGPLREFVADCLLSKQAKQRGIFNAAGLEKLVNEGGPFSRGLWGALCLELWHRQFIDASPV